MYEYFKNLLKQNSCSSIGVCSIHPSVSALYEILLNEIRETSFYIVKLKEFNLINKKAMEKLIEGLSIFLINTSFNKIKYLKLVKNLNSLKKEIKEKYIEYCNIYNLPCEMITSSVDIKENTTISDLIENSQIFISNKQKNDNKNKLYMFDLIAFFAKLSAINVLKIKKLNNCTSEKIEKFNYEIIRFFSLTNGYSIRDEKIKRRILEFSAVALEIKKELQLCLEEKYGKKETTTVFENIYKGFGILVSGSDLDELENVLNTIEKIELDSEIKEKINVYTNQALINAHLYPFFKENKYLKGHIGTDNPEYDFSIFKGSILLSQNFVQKIDNLYRGEIFSNKIISFERVSDINNNDYSPLVLSALKEENRTFEKKESYKIEYDSEKLKKDFIEYNDDEIAVIIGEINKKQTFKDEDKIINLQYPFDELFNFIDILKEKQIKITLLFTECNLLNLEVVLLLLNKEIEIYLASCSNLLINPHVIQALKNEFKINVIE